VKSIYLLRHAKSDWNASSGSDHERPLNKRGIRSALGMGKHLSSNTVPPALILCSTAIRTRETLALIQKGSNWDSEAVFESFLYHATLQTVKERIQALPVDLESVMIIGHQPTTGEVASWFLGGKQIGVPTCAFIHLRLDIMDWKELNPGHATLHQYVIPSQFMSGVND
jgi:phosphohistidine phosphatase